MEDREDKNLALPLKRINGLTKFKAELEPELIH